MKFNCNQKEVDGLRFVLKASQELFNDDGTNADSIAMCNEIYAKLVGTSFELAVEEIFFLYEIIGLYKFSASGIAEWVDAGSKVLDPFIPDFLKA